MNNAFIGRKKYYTTTTTTAHASFKNISLAPKNDRKEEKKPKNFYRTTLQMQQTSPKPHTICQLHQIVSGVTYSSVPLVVLEPWDPFEPASFGRPGPFSVHRGVAFDLPEERVVALFARLVVRRRHG